MRPTSHMPVRARALTGFAEVVAAHGGDPRALLARANIPERALRVPEMTFPVERLAHVMELAGEELGLPDFGLRMAQHQDISVLGTVALIAQHSATVHDALLGIARYLPYHTPAATLALVDDAKSDTCDLCYELSLDPDLPTRMVMELSYSIAYKFMQLVTTEDGRRWQINLRHRKGLSAASYKRYFKCPVRLGQPRYSLTVPSKLLRVPIDPANSDLRLNAERMLSNLMRRFPLDIGRQAQSLIDRQLANGGGSIQRIAKQLGLHTRTLQRRLAEQGLFFEDIVDGVRRIRAEEYLPYQAIPLAQVAALLGYSEQSSLNRSCMRWFGKTPALLRAEGVPKRGLEQEGTLGSTADNRLNNWSNFMSNRWR